MGVVILRGLVVDILAVTKKVIKKVLFSGLKRLLTTGVLKDGTKLSVGVDIPTLITATLLFLIVFTLVVLQIVISICQLGPMRLLGDRGAKRGPPGTG